nr:ATP-dependent RNA helicase HrpA [Conexibacter sp. SYSU D00693]
MRWVRITYPPQLPVSARRDELLEVLRDHQVVIVAGETGSGKTTQLPKMLLELGRGEAGMIAHTQPRRLAARTVAQRIAEELGVQLGREVGYAVRFSDRSSAETQVRLMTDGLLLAEIARDPLLRRYSTVVVDEAHERSLNIDFLLGCLKRILPRRPDLKVVITSATIETDRFSAHFDGAPVVEVSGRTYPVEVRYRPVVDPDDPEAGERDQAEAIGDAVEELFGEGRGDVLVFLSGEREIRDTAEGLRGRLGDGVEVLPLFARLSAEEQQRVFKPGGKPRVVLATNVAETSLTVPGIRYVVDPGTARISRYSARLKVRRLPIERISQASANQRKGRCGRVAEGICIRLYAEEDFEARPAFTDPEVQRTSLAAVILQMAALGLGDVEDFPFLDPPDRRQVRDGLALLHELGALDPQQEDPRKRLTKLGRKLARLPVDPRLGRMVLEADRRHCATEVVVIAAALSIQDPRERPADKRQAADERHARFADETSDFLALLNLWNHLRERQRVLSGSAFRRECKSEFLHVLRIREWQDLAGQLRSAAKDVGVRFNQQPAEPAAVHQALLAGLLSHVGVRDARRKGEYLGARGARFAVFPASALAKKPPSWVMAAELVETSRLWGRTVARIEPAWIEPLAEHLVRRTHEEPRWERRRGSAVVTERVTLYGLPVVAGRRVGLARLDPAGARELFLRKALVERDWDTRQRFFAENGRRLEEVEELEHRSRRRGLLASDETLLAFFDARVPAEVVDARSFDRWWRDARKDDPDLLTLPRELLVDEAAAGSLDDPDERPVVWRDGELEMALSYRFEPGAPDDGVTVHVPLTALAALDADAFTWQVPALREELVTALLRGLPKELRKPLVPVPETAKAVVARLRPGREPLLEAVAREVAALRGVRIAYADWDLERVPDHLRLAFRVEDEQGRVVAEGRDLDALRAAARPLLQEQLTAATPDLERHGLRTWDGVGELPRRVELPGSGGAVAAFPALVDEGETVGVRVLDTPEQQAAAMAAGTRRLLLLTSPSPAKAVRDRLSPAAQLTLATAPHGSLAAVLQDATVAAVDALVAQAGGPAWDAASFGRLRDHVAGHLVPATAQVVDQAVEVLDAVREVRRGLEALRGPQFAPVREDVSRQLGRLVHPGFLAGVGVRRLPDVLRYVRGAARRLERVPDALAVDLDRLRAVQELEALLAARRAAWPAGRPLPEALREVPWMLEELRMSHFAQGLGARKQVSAKRIRKALDEAAREALTAAGPAS